MEHSLVKCGILVLMLAVSSTGLSQTADQLDIPLPVQSKVYQFEILSNSGYTDQEGRRVIDVIEGYQVDLALSVETESGQPVSGLQPEFDLEGSGTLIGPGKSTPLTRTNESGILEFGITAGKKGMDKMTVSFGKNEATVYFNIISLQINDQPDAPTLESGLAWSELMEAKLDYVDGELEVSYPEPIQEQDGEILEIWGFMMPLTADVEQTHFLVTSSPPFCFFHIPGGPAGVVEVFADDGIETSWDPVKLRGTFELVKNATTGVIYQLKDAELIEE